MAINEAYNVDCVEYMRSLPDGYFDLAVCDPPYGSGNDTKLGGQKVRRNIRPVLQTGTGSRAEDGKSITALRNWGGQNDSENGSRDTSSRNRFQGGTWATRYCVPTGGVLN